MNSVGEFKTLRKDLADHLYRTRVLELLHVPSLNAYSHVGESEREFATRLRQALREARDEEVDRLTTRYERRLSRLADQVRRAQIVLQKKQATAEARSREFMVSVGESLLGMFLGRRTLRTASSSLGKYRMKTTSEMAIEEAEEKLDALEKETASLEEELKAEVDAIREPWDNAVMSPEKIPVIPRRGDIEIEVFALSWVPSLHVLYQDSAGVEKRRWQSLV